MEWQEWQTGFDVRNNQSVTSKDESNDNPVIGHHQQPLWFSIEV